MSQEGSHKLMCVLSEKPNRGREDIAGMHLLSEEGGRIDRQATHTAVSYQRKRKRERKRERERERGKVWRGRLLLCCAVLCCAVLCSVVFL